MFQTPLEKGPFTFTGDKGTKTCLSCCIRQGFPSFIHFMLRKPKPFSRALWSTCARCKKLPFCQILSPHFLQVWGTVGGRSCSIRAFSLLKRLHMQWNMREHCSSFLGGLCWKGSSRLSFLPPFQRPINALYNVRYFFLNWPCTFQMCSAWGLLPH